MSSWLELKIPPLLVGFFTGALMWLAARAVPVLASRFLPASCDGNHSGFGAVIMLLGIVSFLQAGTTVNPMKPESCPRWLQPASMPSLATDVSRLSIRVTRMGDVLSQCARFPLSPRLRVYMNRFQIELRKGRSVVVWPEIHAYRSRVRRWL